MREIKWSERSPPSHAPNPQNERLALEDSPRWPKRSPPSEPPLQLTRAHQNRREREDVRENSGLYRMMDPVGKRTVGEICKLHSVLKRDTLRLTDIVEQRRLRFLQEVQEIEEEVGEWAGMLIHDRDGEERLKPVAKIKLDKMHREGGKQG